MKIVVILFLLAILYCLASGVVYLVKANSRPTQLAKALTWRVGLSLLLFLLLLLAYLAGWISPHRILVVPANLN